MSRRRPGLLVLVLALALLLGTGCPSTPTEPSRVVVRDAFTVEGTTVLAVYLEVGNEGGPDAIVGAELRGPDADLARSVTLHRRAERDGLSLMEPTDAIDLDGGTAEALAPDRAHIMLEAVDQEVAEGRTLALRLDLRRGDPVDIEVRVVTADVAVGLLTGDRP